MKKLLAFAVFIITLAFPTQSVFAADTSLGPNTAPMLNPWAVVNSNNTVTVFWNQIENVQQYRVCINEECPAKWNEYKPSENSATFPLGINETKLFWVHAWLTNNATNYNTLFNTHKWADSFKWVTASNVAVLVPTTVPPTTVPPTTVPPTTTPSSAATSYSSPLVGVTGSICSDGWHSPSTGSGTCSWHGGIKEQYAPVIIKNKPITPIIIKPIKLPSSWFPKVKCYFSC
jgi:hypothetical protein